MTGMWTALHSTYVIHMIYYRRKERRRLEWSANTAQDMERHWEKWSRKLKSPSTQSITAISVGRYSKCTYYKIDSSINPSAPWREHVWEYGNVKMQQGDSGWSMDTKVTAHQSTSVLQFCISTAPLPLLQSGVWSDVWEKWQSSNTLSL